MAQRTEKEETEFKVVPETITLCANNCGVTGNPATDNMCQKCFNAITSAASAAGIVIPPHKFSAGDGVKSPRSSSTRSQKRYSYKAETRRHPTGLDRGVVEEESDAVAKKVVNRCSGCRRKVGLTGFRCRCGELFCSEHRYSDRHDCCYDYKAVGREAIARENPMVKAAKIIRL